MKRRADTPSNSSIMQENIMSSPDSAVTRVTPSPAWLRLATGHELDAQFDRLESPAPDRLRGLFTVELLTVRGSDRVDALWRPLREQLNRGMPTVFRGKSLAVTSGHNVFAGKGPALFFDIGQHPTKPGHLVIDYDTAATPRLARPLAAEVRRLTGDALLCRTVWRGRSAERPLLHFLLHPTTARPNEGDGLRAAENHHRS
ncbi:hypothetical protein IU449_24670 [Nocardia higoensis]|uniref:Uncharacterized protein n=1 Tax=Nocardia higoensis TaxID=228599 RepID=A0ABS0DGU9_9NOCA|nr:hypothetical protein [Nocardia higoensis]MBF6357701.1 hypothetical protein [Nocardia higoensis]